MFRIKRVYEPPARSDGTRILVDRLWPRGLKKDDAAVDVWMSDLAPSTALRQWFGHDARRWQEFRRRYRQELRSRSSDVEGLSRLGRDHTVTLLFGAKDVEHNQAVVLKAVLEKSAPGRSRNSVGRKAPTLRRGKPGDFTSADAR